MRGASCAASAELKYGRLIELQKNLDADNAKLKDLQGGHRMLKEDVDGDDVAEIVARWTGIPVSRMMEGERTKLLRMEDGLKRRVVWQDSALSRGDMKDIVEIQLGRLKKLLADKKITLKLMDKATEHLAEAGYDPVYGARSLKRLLQKEIHDEIATRILDNELGGGEVPETVNVDYKDGRLVFSKG